MPVGRALGRRVVAFRQAGRLVFGRPDAMVDDAVVAVPEALTRAALAWETPADMRHRLWWRFTVNTGINQASAVLRLPYGAFPHDGRPRSLMWALMDEVGSRRPRASPSARTTWPRATGSWPTSRPRAGRPCSTGRGGRTPHGGRVVRRPGRRTRTPPRHPDPVQPGDPLDSSGRRGDGGALRLSWATCPTRSICDCLRRTTRIFR